MVHRIHGIGENVCLNIVPCKRKEWKSWKFKYFVSKQRCCFELSKMYKSVLGEHSNRTLSFFNFEFETNGHCIL